MASTYSTNLAIELIGTGDQAGSWGNTTNTNLGTLIEQAISGYVTQAVSTGTDTTITIPNGATGVARNMYIELTGTGGTNTNLIVPANKKLYFIFNNTSSGQVTVKVSGQTGVSVPNKAKMILVSNGTDIVDATNYIGNISAASANITVLTSASATITNLIATSASITTLTNNPTFSGGTANGVLYLNGSKVATSGSALTFNGTTLVNTGPLKVGDGAASNTSRLMVNNATNTATGIQLFQDGIESWIMGMPANSAGLAWSASGAEKMRLTSSVLSTDSSINVGIGTTSPAAKLDVSTGIRVNSSGTVTSGFANAVNIGTWDALGYDSGGTDVVLGGYRTSQFTGIRFYGGGSERMRLDSSGNLGLGVTPSAWTSQYSALQFGASASLATYKTSSDELFLQANAFENTSGNWTYIASLAASQYWQSAGKHIWRTAASGTAGNAISFTQAMTLDASGNLGVGTTSPVGRIDTNDSVNDISYTSFRNSNTGASARARLRIGNNGSSNAFTVDVYGGNHSTSANLVEITNQFNAALSFGTNGIERGRFSAAGNFGISEGNNPTQALSLYRSGSSNAIMSAGNSNTGLDGTWFGVDTAGNGIVNVRGAFPLLFSTSANERARITSGGEFLLGGTSTAQLDGVFGQIIGSSTKSNAGIALETQYGAYMLYTESADALIFWDSGDNTERGRFTSGGYFKASNTGTYANSTAAYHELRTSAADYSAMTSNSNASPYGAYFWFSAADPNNTTNLFLLCNGWNGSTNVTRATIRSNGGIANYQSNNVDLSDARTKNSITPAASMWDKIGALEIVTYKYNDQTHDDVNVGVIAQQVESVEPVWVDADGFGETPEGEEPLKTVYTKDITFAAIKALQEAMARIESLEAKVAALESK